ncbi:hypothetical protein IQ268_15395 [Oculatella sp. LEGE 06141]|uniref:hypothetical protein n=1 Tax=Oculatella sp. LEGE 06141 TaxID=1828648 RepID=UPI00187E21F4|nr:hypothetical protein [Oculatella sp. LEGE 06141]MBE9179956.1 hypothetical protein [Oculatella sp. LEGE 06141]
MKEQHDPTIRQNSRKGVGLGAIALSLTALLLPACNLAEPTEQTTVTTEDIAEDTSALIGQEITVRNIVEDVIGEDGFLVETDAGEPVLVINATGAPFELPDPAIPIQATGTVEALSADQVESQYGLTLDRNLFAEYEGQPAIVAASMALAPNPEYFYDAPEGYFGDQAIAVEGDVRLLEQTDNAFALFEEGWINDVGVLVIGVDSELEGVPIEEGENVAVTGVARQVSEQLLRDANLGWDDNQLQEFLARYENRPVIVADGVYPSAVDPAPGN